MTTETPALLISPRDAAKLLSVSERKLWAMTHEDTPGIPYCKCGRLVRYSPDDLRDYIAANKRGGVENPEVNAAE